MSDVQYLTVDKLTTKEISRIFGRITCNPMVAYNGVPCWIWTGMDDGGSGYGYFKFRNHNIRLHRLMYAWAVGPLPTGIQHGELDHLCRRVLCCNPAHLEFVTRIVNRRRRMLTHCKYGHPFEGQNLSLRKDKPERICRLCAHNRVRKFYNRPPLSS